ncbi:hypothetical protein EVAR_13837_1 [Eumeta japonica]|uniref:Uncharacterized protein n=1 Tax=Eumeta variegata TaxID=151549 RepID=A0A4C1U147_EUMVA|nr:hypothetical protein EVAR_13837_1 [Eumeta japonica]
MNQRVFLPLMLTTPPASVEISRVSTRARRRGARRRGGRACRLLPRRRRQGLRCHPLRWPVKDFARC